MNSMFEDIILFGIILATNIIMTLCIRYCIHSGSRIRILLQAMGTIGVLFHELAHFTMCLLTGVRPGKIKVSHKAQSGYVTIDPAERVSFLQTVMISFAPLLISSYIAYYCIYLIFLTNAMVLFKFVAGIIFISIILACTPSGPDLNTIREAFFDDPLYSWYQIGLVAISTLVVFFLNLPLPYYLSFIHYILIGILYTLLRYFLLGIRYLVDRVGKKGDLMHIEPPLTHSQRTINKPKPQKKTQIPRGQW